LREADRPQSGNGITEHDMRLIPTREQWRNWSMPSKLTAVGTLLALIAIAVAVIIFAIQMHFGASREAVSQIHSDIEHLGSVVAPLEATSASTNAPSPPSGLGHFVEILQRFYADKDAVVLTNATVSTRDRMQTRKVNLLVKQKVGMLEVQAAVEVLSSTGTVEVSDIDPLVVKYSGPSGLEVDKVVVVAAHFSPSAAARCKLLGFSPLLAERESVRELDLQAGTPLSPPADRKGHWVVAASLKEEVKPELLGPDGRALDPRLLLKGHLIHKKTGQDGGTPFQWASAVVQAQSRAVKQAYVDHAGESYKVTIPVPLADYVLKVDDQSYPVDQLMLDFGEKMVIPDLNVERVQLTTPGGQPRSVLVGSGIGASNEVTIMTEAPTNTSSPPSRLYLEVRPLEHGR